MSIMVVVLVYLMTTLYSSFCNVFFSARASRDNVGVASMVRRVGGRFSSGVSRVGSSNDFSKMRMVNDHSG